MKYILKLTFTLLSFFYCLTHIQAKENTPFPTNTTVYKKIGNTSLKIDIFLPPTENAKEKKTAIVFFFGGGWVSGKTSQFHQQAADLANKGIVCFCADYRVKKKHKTTPFEAVSDAKSAIRWVRKNADTWNIDQNKIIASGGSAGGHLAACTSLIEGNETKGEDLLISSKPNALILFNPVLDTTSKGYGSSHFNKKNQTKISPCHNIQKGNPPTLLMHGTADKIVPFENAKRFQKLMKKARNTCTLISYTGEDHGFFNSAYFKPNLKGKHYDTTMANVYNFLFKEKYLDKDYAK